MNALMCDNCGAVLPLDVSGREDSNGERAAWLVIQAAGGSFDACTRSCAVELLADGKPLAGAIDEQLAVIADIARIIREDREGES